MNMLALDPYLDSNVKRRISGFWNGVKQRNFHFEPQVLRVCKQLEKEGKAVLYKENALTVHVLDDTRYDSLHVAALEHEFTFDHDRVTPKDRDALDHAGMASSGCSKI